PRAIGGMIILDLFAEGVDRFHGPASFVPVARSIGPGSPDGPIAGHRSGHRIFDLERLGQGRELFADPGMIPGQSEIRAERPRVARPELPSILEALRRGRLEMMTGHRGEHERQVYSLG